MPDPTPQEVVEARELIAGARREYAAGTQNFSAEEVGALLSLLDEAERVLEPFSSLAHHLADYRDRDHFVSGLTGDVSVKSSEISKVQSLLLKLKGPDHG